MQLTNLRKYFRSIVITIFFCFLGVVGAMYLRQVVKDNNIQIPFITKQTRVEIASNVEGVEVIFNDQSDFPPEDRFLRLPLSTKDLKPGKNTIRARKNGYQEVSQEVEIKEGTLNKVFVFMLEDIQVTFDTIKAGSAADSYGYLSNGSILYKEIDKIKEYNTKNQIVELSSVNLISNVQIEGNNALVIAKNDVKLFKYPKTLIDLNLLASSMKLSKDGNFIYYTKDSSLYRYDIENQISQKLSDHRDINILYLVPSNAADVILQEQTGGFTKLYIFKNSSKNISLLKDIPEEVTDLTFSEDSKSFAYLTKSGLYINDLDGKELKHINYEKDTQTATLVWLSNKELILSEKQNKIPYLDRLYLVNIDAPDKRLFITSATIIKRLDLNTGVKVSKDGKKLLMKQLSGPFTVGNISR